MAGSVRPAMDSAWDAREQQLTLLFCRAPGSSTWNLINQGKIFTPSAEAEKKDFGRIGDPKKKTKYGATTTTATISVYVDDDLKDLSEVMGQTLPQNPTGTEELRLDPTKVRDFMAVNYDGTTVGVSRAISVEYLNAFKPGSWKGMTVDGDSSDARVAEFEGAADDYYMMKVV